jgi:hypothetical protein
VQYSRVEFIINDVTKYENKNETTKRRSFHKGCDKEIECSSLKKLSV